MLTQLQNGRSKVSNVLFLLGVSDADMFQFAADLAAVSPLLNIGEVALAIDAKPDPHESYDLSKFYKSTSAETRSGVGCAGCSSDCAVWKTSFLEALENVEPRIIHTKLSEYFKSSTLMDTSGTPEWLETVCQERRSSSGFSALNCVRSPFQAGLRMRARTGQPLWRCAEIWRDTVVGTLRVTSAYNIPLLTIRLDNYENLKHQLLARVEDLLGLEHTEQQGFEQHPLCSDATRALHHRTEPSAEARLVSWELNEILMAPGLAEAATLCGFDLAEEFKQMLGITATG